MLVRVYAELATEHTQTHTNNRPANLNQHPIQNKQREVRQCTDTLTP
jgi:hypothetical protein